MEHVSVFHEIRTYLEHVSVFHVAQLLEFTALNYHVDLLVSSSQLLQSSPSRLLILELLLPFKRQLLDVLFLYLSRALWVRESFSKAPCLC